MNDAGSAPTPRSEFPPLQAAAPVSEMGWLDRVDGAGVRHVQIGEPSILAELANPTLVVFWQDGRPIGAAEAQGSVAAAPIGGLDPAPVDGGAGAASLSATVVICTRDRPQELARCLASLPQQSKRPDQIVVVDNASVTDETRQVCERAGVQYVREPRPGLDIARNTGARAASCDIVAYTDDDVVLHPNWLERLVAAFDRPDILAVTGLVLPAELATPAQWHFEKYWSFGQGFKRKDFGQDYYRQDRPTACPVWKIGAGASMAFRRSVFESVGFFDERLDVGAAGCSGDSEFWHRILSAGGACRYEPASVAFHFHRREMAALRKQLRAYMSGHSAALLVQYERTGNLGNLRRVFFDMPLYYGLRIFRKIRRPRSERQIFLWAEMAGYASGVLYYLRAPRPDKKASR